MQAKNIMTQNVATIDASALVSEAIGHMKEKGVHALIVKPKGQERAYGIITEADITYNEHAKRQAHQHLANFLAVRVDPRRSLSSNERPHPITRSELAYRHARL